MKRRQLTSIEKLQQMNQKYSAGTIQSLRDKVEARTDLQGWRNYLVERLSKLSTKNALDLGSGTGDKMLLLSEISSHKPSCSIVDFAKQPFEIKDYLKARAITFYQSDVFDFIGNKNREIYDLITMFGFLHEISDHKKLIKQLPNICGHNTIILVSDNSLHKNVQDLHSAFNLEFSNTVSYFSRSYFNLFHIFKKSAGRGPKYFIRIQFGRVDDILIIACSYDRLPKIIKRISISV